MQKTDIEWTTFTANPIKYRRKSDGKTVWACVKTSPGCAHCYAEAIALRFDRGKLFSAANMAEVEPYLDEAELHKMLTAKTIGGVPVAGSRCFVGDMTDVFGEWVSDEMLDRLFAVFALRSDVTFQVLTKRAERMAEYMLSRSKSSKFWEDAARTFGYALRWEHGSVSHPLCPWPLANVWLGVSAEDQKRADERIPHLLRTPAAVRFLSCEPLIAPVDLATECTVCDYCGRYTLDKQSWECPCGKPLIQDAYSFAERVDWVIVGGESGPGARPCNVDWIRAIRDQCSAARVPCFVKQLGSRPFTPHPGIEWREYDYVYDDDLELSDRKGGEPSEWPEDLRVREYPTPAACRGA